MPLWRGATASLHQLIFDLLVLLYKKNGEEYTQEIAKAINLSRGEYHSRHV
jgi:hypothetical protein